MNAAQMALYARVSTERQVEAQTINSQSPPCASER